MDTVNLIQTWMKLFTLSRSANTLGKGMNPTILHPAMDK